MHQSAMLARMTAQDRANRDALLILVDSTGIPVLVRTYGEVQRPPSAAVGIASAVFQAARSGDATELAWLRSRHRHIVYVPTEEDFLLILVSENDLEHRMHHQSMCRTLQLVLRVLQLTIGMTSLATMDTSQLRASISAHVTVIDYIVTQYNNDMRLCSGAPVCVPTVAATDELCDQKALLHGMWLRSNIVVRETASHRCSFAARDLVLLCLLTDCIRGGDGKHLGVEATVEIGRKPVEVIAVAHRGDFDEGDVFFGIFSVNATPEEIQDVQNAGTIAAGFIEDVAPRASVHVVLESQLPTGFLCCYVMKSHQAERTASGGGRVICVCTTNWSNALARSDQAINKTALTSEWINEPLAHRLLTQFASGRANAPCDGLLDYRRDEEVCTLLHCVRAPLTFYVVCGGHLGFGEAVQVGDTLASTFLCTQW